MSCSESSSKQKSGRNRQGVLLIQNNKYLYSEVLLWSLQHWNFPSINIIPKHMESHRKWWWLWLSGNTWYWNKWLWFIWKSDFSVLRVLVKTRKKITADYAVSRWIICVIPHIRKYLLMNSDKNNIKQVNNFIKHFLWLIIWWY